ncbi:MAG: glycosyltransferase [Arcobacter sp.]|uniref:glycosyltransferase n=1 Tax=Arcobacter sp. TaxID=1872629 RepID=UPI003CFD8107
MIILHTLHWVQFAGTEKVCVDLCNELSKEHTVYLLTNDKIKPYINESVNFINLDFEKNRHNPFFLYKVAKIVEKINPDVIHIHNTKELEIMYNARLFMKKKVPIIGSRHNPVVKKKFSLADLGVAVSEETRIYTNAKRNITILNGIPFKEVREFENKNKFTIVGVGRLAQVKGFHTLINALSKVNFDFKLNIVGEGEQKEELLNLIKSLKLENKIELVGFVRNVQDYIYNSDLQIISSSEEGLSLALIEGIFYARVLVATDIANHKEILGEELVFDNRVDAFVNKLNDVYEDYKKYEKLFGKVKETKEEYSIEKMVKQYVEAYKSLIK